MFEMKHFTEKAGCSTWHHWTRVGREQEPLITVRIESVESLHLVSVKWIAMGAVGVDKAETFALALQEAIKIAKEAKS